MLEWSRIYLFQAAKAYKNDCCCVRSVIFYKWASMYSKKSIYVFTVKRIILRIYRWAIIMRTSEVEYHIYILKNRWYIYFIDLYKNNGYIYIFLLYSEYVEAVSTKIEKALKGMYFIIGNSPKVSQPLGSKFTSHRHKASVSLLMNYEKNRDWLDWSCRKIRYYFHYSNKTNTYNLNLSEWMKRICNGTGWSVLDSSST